MIIPNPEELLPLPAPVWTRIRPFLTFLVFIISSRSALRARILALCSAAVSVIGASHPLRPASRTGRARV